jgi:glycine cleavage system H protein
VGRALKSGEQFGTVESVKAVSELFSPVTGEVIEVNAALAGQPETVNKDPHGGAWMIVVRITDPASLGGLMDAKAYEAFVESEAK